LGSFISSKTKGDDMEIMFKEDRIKLFVDTIAKSINLDPQNAELKVSGGKVTVFQIARLGAKLDQTQTKVDIKNAIFSRMDGTEAKNINLNVAVLKPEITDDAVSNLGLNELIGTGTTNFVKSPANRVHNIQVGADTINGSLLKPGEEFSTLGRLGTIDASTGYLPELVIKNNQTVPDYGGGLCQVSTTLFRAAMNAGLKITERQNHSYRVSYYEPPVGMDATIYDPSPDFKFVNTYDHHIFIQSRIVGTKITFDIYGTKDSRVATVSDPVVYDYVEPPARIDTQTDTLPAGEQKQVQKPHQGASAKFQYKVVKDGQTLQDKIFISVYVALPEKWLVGIGAAPAPAEPAPAPAPAPVPEPTPAPVPETPAPVITPTP
jgi:vancomycin resistance protein YoaR